MNPQPALPFFTSNRCKVLIHPGNEGPSDIAVRAHATGSYKKSEPVEVRARRWIEKHPQIYRAFEQATLERIERGFRHYSAKAVVEYVRWHTDTPGGSPFKIANAVTTYLALKFMNERPEHVGFFKTMKRAPQ